ncbi:hypothetical protein ABEP17_07870 [Priestia flexa]|uniref:hypothetical protein n=1 Tax=Priestia flexa TaxID=86664 RepID=UPI003D29E7CD
MEIKAFGILTLLVVLIIPFITLRKHYIIMVFFSVFTATAAININQGSFNISIIPVHIIAAIFAIRIFLGILKRGLIYKKNLWLGLFVIWSALTVVFLAIVDDYIPSGLTVRRYFSGEGYDLVQFSTGNVTQLMYLLFGYLIYFVTVEFIMSTKNPIKLVQKTLATLIYAACFICLIGIYEMVAKYLGLPFMTIFRNFTGVVEYTNYRISSVAHEPSMFAYFIIISVALCYFYGELSVREKLNQYNVFFLSFLILIGLFSTSTTFLLGFTVFLIFTLNYYVKKHKLNIFISVKTYFSFTTIVLLSFWLLNIPFIREKTLGRAIETLSFNNFSGADRLEKVIHHLEAFQHSPLVGLGFGTARSYDGFTTLLVNLGIIGFTFFLLFIISSIYRLNKISKVPINNLSTIAKGLLVGFICWFAMFMIAVPEIYFIYIWILFALIECISIISKTSEDSNK